MVVAPHIFGPIRIRVLWFLVILGKRLKLIQQAEQTRVLNAVFYGCNSFDTPLRAF
jgi:hypothetical protein